MRKNTCATASITDFLFENMAMKARTETKLIAGCHGGSEVNLVTSLGLYSIFSSLDSLLTLEQKHEMITAISVEVFTTVLQIEQKHIESGENQYKCKSSSGKSQKVIADRLELDT